MKFAPNNYSCENPVKYYWPIFLRTFLDNPMKLDFFSANYHKPWLSWFPNQMSLGLCHLFLSQKRSWDRNAQWSTIRTSMIVGGYHKWATCTCRHKMEGGGGTFHEVWHWQMQWVGGCKQPCAKSWGWRHIEFQFKCNVKRGTFAYCLTHLDSNNIIMTIAELLEKEWILTSLKGREGDFLVQH